MAATSISSPLSYPPCYLKYPLSSSLQRTFVCCWRLSQQRPPAFGSSEIFYKVSRRSMVAVIARARESGKLTVLESEQPELEAKCGPLQDHASQDLDLHVAKENGHLIRHWILTSTSGSGLKEAFGLEKPKPKDNFRGISPGTIGSLVLGFLFLQTRRTTMTCKLALQDMHAKVKHADAELCCKTNSAIRSKLEKEQALREANKEQQENESLLYQIISSKSKENELRQQLEAETKELQNLEEQENCLRFAHKKSEDDCTLLLDNLNKELKKIQMLEDEFLAINSQIKLEEETVISQRRMLEKEDALKGLALHVADESIDCAQAKVEKRETQISTTCRCLNEKDSMMQSLTMEFSALNAKNQASEKELTELQDQLTDQGLLLRKEVAWLKGTLDKDEAEVQVLASKLAAESQILEGIMKAVNSLGEEKNGLMEALNEKQNLVKQLMSQLDTISCMLVSLGHQTVSLNKELTDSNILACDLEKMYEQLEAETASKLSTVSKGLSEEQAVTVQLKECLDEAKQVLETLEMQLYCLHQMMNSELMCYEQLKDEIASIEAIEAVLDDAFGSEVE